MTAADRFGEPDLTAPRRRGKHDALTHYAIVERPGAAPTSAPTDLATRCRGCGTAGVVLHQDPRRNDVEREICGRCQGIANADKMGLGPRRDGGQ